MGSVPARIDLRSRCPAVYDQLQTNSCTGNAVGAAIHFDLMKRAPATEVVPTPSRLFLYYNGRLADGSEDADWGASIRDVIKSAVSIGHCEEYLWPFRPDRVTMRPAAAAYDDAKRSRIEKYMSVPQFPAMIQRAMADGFPVICGIGVYESIESAIAAKSGQVTLPTPGERLRGGHAIVLVGYDLALQRYQFRNSWGPKWGDSGYGTLPFNYVHAPRLCGDLWAIRFA